MWEDLRSILVTSQAKIPDSCLTHHTYEGLPQWWHLLGGLNMATVQAVEHRVSQSVVLNGVWSWQV